LGPENPAANPDSRIRLHLPDRAPPGRNAEPAHANTQRPGAAKPQANAVAPAPNLPIPAPPMPNTSPSSPSAAPTPAQPAPVPAASPPAAETRPAATAGEGAEHILFQPDDANLAGDAKQELDRLARRLSADGRLHVELVAYA